MNPLPRTRSECIRASFIGLVLLFVVGWFVLKPILIRGAYEPQVGDVVFQSLPGRNDLVEAIEGITGSPFSHCGVVQKIEGEWMVIEAIGEVCRTPLQAWIARGRGNHVAAYRLRKPYRQHIPAMNEAMEQLLGRPYDFRYRLEDAHIYCSELVYRGYQMATDGKPLGVLRKLGDMNWKPYRAVIQKYEQCGPNDLPLERHMITPKDLAEAPELERVFNFGFEESAAQP